MTIGNGKLEKSEFEIVMEQVRQQAILLGAYRAELVNVAEISLDASFRTLCESNACGNYGKNYMCPPDAGNIHDLMKKIKSYKTALVYQTVGMLEDSYDFEGMMEAGLRHNQLAQKLWDFTDELGIPAGHSVSNVHRTVSQGVEEVIHLGAGGCRLCEICGKREGVPCRFPKRAMGSLETYGINVSLLAPLAHMKYINGQNTVTYFGAVFMR